jgi:hypothetical protein
MRISSLTLLVLTASWDWSGAASVAESTGALKKEDEAYWSRLMQEVDMSVPTVAPTPPPTPPSTLPPPTTTKECLMDVSSPCYF